jgi:hypothetical protein
VASRLSAAALSRPCFSGPPIPIMPWPARSSGGRWAGLRCPVHRAASDAGDKSVTIGVCRLRCTTIRSKFSKAHGQTNLSSTPSVLYVYTVGGNWRSSRIFGGLYGGLAQFPRGDSQEEWRRRCPPQTERGSGFPRNGPPNPPIFPSIRDREAWLGNRGQEISASEREPANTGPNDASEG